MRLAPVPKRALADVSRYSTINIQYSRGCPFTYDLLPALIEWRRGKKGIVFSAEASINLADDEELMRQMVLAGFATVFVGIETPDESSLAECGKKQNLERDLIGDVKRMQRAGLEVHGGFIVGFDNDTTDIFQWQSISFRRAAS